MQHSLALYWRSRRATTFLLRRRRQLRVELLEHRRLLSGPPALAFQTAPFVSVSAATVIASSRVTTAANFTVRLSDPSTQPVTVGYATADGTAVAGSDYVAIPQAVLTFAPGQTQQTVTVTVDAELPGVFIKTFSVEIVNAQNAIVLNDQAIGTILDPNALPAVLISPATVLASPAGPTDATFVVSLTSSSQQPVTVDYATADGTATAGSDYVATSGTLTFAPGQSQQSVAIPVDPEPAGVPIKTFSVNLSNPAGATVIEGQATGTILNFTFLPSVSIFNATAIASASGPTTATFTVTLAPSSAQPVTVDYATVDGTATAGSDYVAIPTTPLTFAPGQTQQTITVTVNPEPAGGFAKTFNVDLFNPMAATIGVSQATGTILNPNTVPSVSISSTTVASQLTAPTEATFTVSLSAPSSQPVTVNYSTADGTAVAGSDYVAISPTPLTFAPGQTQQTITVTVDPEPVGGFSRTFSVNLSSPNGATIGTGQGIGTIILASPLPTVSIDNPEAVVTAEPDGTTEATFYVSLSESSSQPVTVVYATADGTAQAPGDYVAISATSLTIAPGQTDQTITVTVNAEPAGAAVKTFTLSLSDPTGATISGGQSTATILNIASPPAVTIRSTRVIAFSSTTTTASFFVTLSSPPQQPVTVDYATADGTAIAGQDYVGIPLTPLTFAPGEALQIITVTIDAAPEFDVSKTFTVNFSNPMGLTIVGGQATGTILNISPKPGVSIADTTVLASPSGPTTATVTATLSEPSVLPVNVNIATSDVTAKAGVDYVAVPLTTLIFAPGQTEQTVAVTINAEPSNASGKTFFIVLSNAANATIETALASITISPQVVFTDIFSEDSSRVFQTTPHIAIASETTTASPNGATVTVPNITVSAPTGQTVTVSYATADGTAVAGSDYVAIPATTLAFTPGQTQQPVAVTVNAVPQYEPPRTFNVNLLPPTNAIILSAQATITIDSPDPPPTVSIAGMSVTANPDGPTEVTFLISLSAPINVPATVTYSTTDGTATAGSDYVAIPPTTLTFAPGQTQAMISVQVSPEPAGSSPKTFLVRLSNPNNIAIDGGQATGTINAIAASTGTPGGNNNGNPGNNPPPPPPSTGPVVKVIGATFLKHKRKVTGLQVHFSGALDPASALNPANYLLLGAKHTRKSGTHFSVHVPLVLLSHSGDASTVVFAPGRLQPGSYQLQVLSSPTGGIHDPSGQPLVGDTATLVLSD